MDPQDRIEGEVWRKHHEFAVDQRSPERNKHGSHQALPLAVLSIAARGVQSHHLAFKFFIRSCISPAEFDLWLAFFFSGHARSECEVSATEALCMILRAANRKSASMFRHEEANAQLTW